MLVQKYALAKGFPALLGLNSKDGDFSRHKRNTL
jgi:hypothetical protein